MKKNVTWIIAIIILVVLAIIILSTSKTDVPEEGVIETEEVEEVGDVVPVEGGVEALGEDVLKGAEQVVPDASPVSDDGEVLTPEGVPVDNTALPGSPDAPKQSRSLDEGEIPSEAVQLTVTAAGFIPNEFTVNTGQVVTLSLTSGDKTHVFKFDDAGLQAVAIGVAGNETRAITFNAPEAGDYTFYCDVPGHRGRGETGVMHVK